MRAILELLRISLFPTAAADALVGYWLGGGFAQAEPLKQNALIHAVLPPVAAMLASLFVYHGAMALNDWADREEDRSARPGRPIPSGRIAPARALIIAGLLLTLGAVLGLMIDLRAGALLSCVALLAVLYDLRGRGPWRGPLLLGACRAGNLGFGVLAGSSGALPPDWVWVALATYGMYVFLISRVGRLEDGPAEHVGPSPSLWLLAAAVCFLVTPLLRLPEPEGLRALGLALLGAGALLRSAWPVRDWPRAQLMPTMGRALRLLLVLVASLALCQPGSGAWWIAGGVMCGYPLAHALRRSFPPS